ncbi:MAG: glycosyltransferase family 2 protein, partial [Prevotella sp.]|nr:glycosyltransferase family 2 protein [Prevotella sp.]
VGDFKAVYRARRDFKRWRKDFVKDRQLIQQSREGDGSAKLVPLSILWKYYVKGCRQFTNCIPANS